MRELGFGLALFLSCGIAGAVQDCRGQEARGQERIDCHEAPCKTEYYCCGKNKCCRQSREAVAP